MNYGPPSQQVQNVYYTLIDVPWFVWYAVTAILVAIALEKWFGKE